MQAVFKRRFLFFFLKQAFNPFTKHSSETLPAQGEHSPAAESALMLKASDPQKNAFPCSKWAGTKGRRGPGCAEARTVLPGSRTCMWM